MGYILSESEGMPENLSAEVRRESFYLRGRDESQFFVYPNSDKPVSHGTVEMLLKDIPSIRKALDAIEAHASLEKSWPLSRS